LNVGRSSQEKAVRLSVRLSNAWIVSNGRKIGPDFYTIRKIISKENGWWRRPLLPEVLDQPAPV